MKVNKHHFSLVLLFSIFCFTVNAQQVETYDFSGGNQTYTVPAGVSCIRVKMWGAGGGSADNRNGGNGGGGAFVEGRLAVTPGEQLTIVVGQGGDRGTRNTSGAYNPTVYGGGGRGRRDDRGGGSGGGYSGIFRGSVSAGNALAVAAGGGGGGGSGNTSGYNSARYCGGGGAAVGNTGTRGGDGGGCSNGSGGCGGRPNQNSQNCTNAPDGISLSGGDGENLGNSTYGGAGGGGGWFGGEGGNTGGNNSGGGGGGSSMFTGLLIASSNGSTSGNGNTTIAAGNWGDSYNNDTYGGGGGRGTSETANTGSAGQNGRIVIIPESSGITMGTFTLNGVAGDICVPPGQTVTIAHTGWNANGGTLWYWAGEENPVGSGWVTAWSLRNQECPNQTSCTFTVPNVAAGTRLVVHSNANNGCWGPGVTRYVTVAGTTNKGTITGTNTSATQTVICSGSTISSAGTTGTVSCGTIQYKWYCGEMLSTGGYGNWISNANAGSAIQAAAGSNLQTALSLNNYNPKIDFPNGNKFLIIRRVFSTSYGECVPTCVSQDNLIYVFVNESPDGAASASANPAVFCSPGGSTTLSAVGGSTANDGLVAHFPLTANGNDISGSGLSLSAGGTYSSAGLQLNNSTVVQTAITNVLNNDNHTIAFYIRLDTDGTTDTWRKVFGYEPSGSDRSPGIWRTQLSNKLHWRYDPSNTGISNEKDLTPGEWYYIVGVKSGANFTFYVDGHAFSSAIVSNPKAAGNATLRFGGSNITIRDFRIYNRALSGPEITQPFGSWTWYATNNCTGTPIGYGRTLQQNVTATTNYSVRTINSCGNSVCRTVQVPVNPLPTATISNNSIAEVCVGTAAPNITFTGANGTPPYTFTYNINGGGNQTVSTIGANTSISVPISTATKQALTYNLISVKDSSPTECSQNQSGQATINVTFPVSPTLNSVGP